jgi:hypothetical protein
MTKDEESEYSDLVEKLRRLHRPDAATFKICLLVSVL